MTAPLDLAALKALHEAAIVANAIFGDNTKANVLFQRAVYASFHELLAMADTYHRLCAHVRTAACGPNHSMGDRFAEVDSLKERAEKAEAEKAAMARRLEIATKALRYIVRHREFGAAMEADSALTAIAAHEAERGKE